jgi:hypothetical protein
MKRRLLNLVLVLSIFTVLTGCFATHMGNMSGSSSLDSPNFMYKKQNITGDATATYVLGIGGEARQTLILDAKKNMLNGSPLLKNQALANVAVSYKTTYYLGFIVVVVKCTVSADIVEFGPVQTDFSHLETMNTSATNSTDNSLTANRQVDINKISSPIAIGDNVKIINYFIKPVDGKVLDIQKGEYTVEYTNRNNKTKKVKVLAFQLQKIE